VGGLGSGRRAEREPRRLVERSFVLDIADPQRTGLVPGRQGWLVLRAALMAWSVRARFLIRNVDGMVATMWFEPPVGRGVTNLWIDMPRSGSRRRPYFVCPGPDHRSGTSRRVARLHWPALDPRGFACRACHRLAYRSSQTRGDPAWMRRLKVAAGLAAPAE
jgi:hypothetical protein